MIVGRAHSYADVQAVRAWLAMFPDHWHAAMDAAGVRWIILPAGLSPIWTGHALERWNADIAASGYTGIDYATVAGFASMDPWGPYGYPYIYVSGKYPSAAPHEMAHALHRIWHLDAEALYRAEGCLPQYAFTNAAEFWAESVTAFCYLDGNADAPHTEGCVYRTSRRAFDVLSRLWEAA